MADSKKLKWDERQNRLFETGTSKGVIYVEGADGYETGVAWDGLVSVKQAPDGAEETPIYANNKKYMSLISAENHKGTIDAYTYPDEFMACDGSEELADGVFVGQQQRKQFCMTYATVIGNESEGVAYGENIHLIWNARVAPSQRDYETINENPNALLFSWGYTTTPEDAKTHNLDKPTAYIRINTKKANATAVAALQEMLYGGTNDPKMPTIDEVLDLFEAEGGFGG